MERGNPALLTTDAGSVPSAPGARRPPHHLPPQPTRLVDREEELTRLGALLSREEIRLLTLIGPGGVGKTRLAIAAAERAHDQFPGGVWFVDLTPVVDPTLVVPTIARVVGVRELPGQDLAATLAGFLSDRVCLLLLDNLEHLLAAVPALDALLVACPGLTLLVTSREPLHLRREQVVEIQPLSVPGAKRSSWTVANLATLPAIELFVDRAQAADSNFELTTDNAKALAELSRRLDGLPLAVELAAARIRLLKPAALLARMEHGLDLLRWDTADLPPRHRTLRATLDWSYALLSAEAQAVFRRLGVFAGGFTLEAMGAVAATDDLDVEPLEMMRGLADKHLVRVLQRTEEAPRFGLLATVREYALERLAESGETVATRDRHLAYYLALAEKAERTMLAPEETEWLIRLEHEVDNLRLAHEWASTRGNAEAVYRLVAALALFWVLRGYLKEGAEWIDAALARSYPADPALRARFLLGTGMVAVWSSDDDRAVAHFEGSLAAAWDAGNSALAARVLGWLGTVVYARGDAPRARALVAEMLVLARAADAGLLIGYAFLYRTLFAIGPHGSRREREQLRAELDEPVARLRAVGFRRALAVLLAGRARLLIDVDAPGATAALREALVLGRGEHDPLIFSFVPWLALVLLVERLPVEQVARLASGVAALAARSEAVGSRQMIDVFGSPHDRLVLARAIAAARETLGDAAFAAAEAAGRALTFEELLDELLAVLGDNEVALATTTSGAPHSQQRDSLISPREREVLARVAEGLTNKAIAEALFIAPSTVKYHVTSLLNKLDADNRAQLATIAAHSGLLAD
jgi:predicted ATPase/DNA-binding CsgD family transcriptional regulator